MCTSRVVHVNFRPFWCKTVSTDCQCDCVPSLVKLLPCGSISEFKIFDWIQVWNSDSLLLALHYGIHECHIEDMLHHVYNNWWRSGLYCPVFSSFCLSSHYTSCLISIWAVDQNNIVALAILICSKLRFFVTPFMIDSDVTVAYDQLIGGIFVRIYSCFLSRFFFNER